MKSNQSQLHRWLRFSLIAVVALFASPLGAIGCIAAGLAASLINPVNLTVCFAAYPAIGGSTKGTITTLATNDEETIWEHEVIQQAAQNSPFADNMRGPVGSGKPMIVHNDTTKVAGQSIVITTVDNYGAPGVQGPGVRVGQEEGIKPGDFLLKTSIQWFGGGITNTALTQTIIGENWNPLNQTLIARRLSKQQNDDAMVNLRNAANLTNNVVLPYGKTIDTLGTGDTYSYALVVKSRSALNDIGAFPMNARPNPDVATSNPPPINRFMQFTTDANGRPIKTDAQYLAALQFAGDRGDKNQLFTGEYQDVDGNIIYPWVNIRHGGYGSIGSAIQPEALLGTAIVAKGSSTDLSAGITGGGSTAAAAITPYVNWFEFFSRYAYVPINGVSVTFNSTAASAVTGAFNPRDTYGYFIAINSTDGKVSFFRYTTNTAAVGTTSANLITGLKRLGSTSSGDYLTTLGDVTWGTAPWTTTADGNGYQGLTEGAVPVGSHIYETNSKGVPIAYGFGLGAMALVCGYGKVPLAGGGFKTMANRTQYIAPHGQAFSDGLEVAWGTAAFTRPDGSAPNYTLNVFARSVPGVPNVA